jgi:hypothetical protein
MSEAVKAKSGAIPAEPVGEVVARGDADLAGACTISHCAFDLGCEGQ